MDFDIETTNNHPFYLCEEASESRKATSHSTCLRHSFRSWKSGFHTEERNMEAIENALRPKSIVGLSESNFLPNDFNVETCNLLDVAPFHLQISRMSYR